MEHIQWNHIMYFFHTIGLFVKGKSCLKEVHILERGAIVESHSDCSYQ